MRMMCKNHTKEEKELSLHRIHKNSRGFQDTEKSHHFVNFNNNKPNGYNQSHASHLKNGNAYAVSLSHPEIILEDGITGSDIILNDSSLFLETRTLKSYIHDNNDVIDVCDDCNNNNKSNINSNSGQNDDLERKDSLFFDISNSTQDLVLEHSENNNNNVYLQTYSQRKLIKLNGSLFKKTSVSQLQDDPVIQQRGTVCTQAGQQSCNYTAIRNHVPEHFLFSKTKSPDSESSEYSDVSSMNETNSSSDLDVNMTMETLNNFSMATSKHDGIQCLANKDEKTKNANIRQLESASTCLEEAKILNTAPNLPKNMTDEYQEELKSKHKVEVIFSEGIEKCELDSAEKEIGRKEYDTDLLSQENPSDDGNMKSRRSLTPVIEPLLKGSPIICENISCFVSKSCISDDKIESKNWSWSSGENGEHLLKIIEALPSSLAPKSEDQKKSLETAMYSRNNCDKQVPPKTSGTNRNSANASADPIKYFQTKHPRECADTSSSFRHESILKERSSLLDYDDEKSLFSDDSLNNISITNSVVYKSMAEKVTLTPPCVSFSTTRSPGKDTGRYSYPVKKDNSSPEVLGDFDVYNIETAMPKIDWIALEEHLTRAAKEADWYLRRRNDREEIRRKLAMDSDGDDYYCGERVTKKPSLSTRLQSGMNLQICFMNERASDQESQGSDHDLESSFQKENICGLSSAVENTSRLTDASDKDKTVSNSTLAESTSSSQSLGSKRQRPSIFFNRPKNWSLQSTQKNSKRKEKEEEQEDFMTRQARLQAEARMALAQAKEMARMQMEVERQRKKKSPIADIVGFTLPDGRHRLSRQILTDMNVAQLQVIVNDLHTQIENLNEELVQLLLERDDLHMQQDSMLVDIEDLTRYLNAKNDALCNQQSIVQVDPAKTISK
ncbi:general transcriptional corepressor trfA-like [Limulus polyphemus]|uniref:General transcriptional corepressor trfA-like n=1 Tax=Limulus polyphemus TaxID=6850 RepID=A0ABM1BNL0_LIMPO|nr:general transcriptional corepressor trfA-like [Limulus polyphemus]